MSILAIETTGKYPSVAILKGDDWKEKKDIHENNIYEVQSENEMNSLKELTGLIYKVLEKSQSQIDDITQIAISVGAGSFTGIRIGVTTARALCQGLNIEGVNVQTLESFRYVSYEDKDCENFNNKKKGMWQSPCMAPHLKESVWICPILNARRKQVYGGVYKLYDEYTAMQNRSKDNINHIVVEGQCYLLADYLNILEKKIEDYVERKRQKAIYPRLKIIFYGDGIDAYTDDLLEFAKKSFNGDIQFSFAEADKRNQCATNVLKNGIDLLKLGKSVNYKELLPNYMRKAEAERKLDLEKQELLENAVKDMQL